MPIVTIKAIEGVFTPEQQARAIKNVTDAMVDIEGETMRSLTWVIFEEVKSGAWGIGGGTITAQDVKDIQSGKTQLGHS